MIMARSTRTKDPGMCMLLVDGGMARFEVIEKLGPDVKCRCTDPGLLLPRGNLTFWRDGSSP